MVLHVRDYRLTVTSNEATAPPSSGPLARSGLAGFGAGAAVGLMGGLVGLGGAEFRLPLLLTVFGFAALAAVIVNKAMSLVVVVVAIPARLAAVPLSEVASEWGAVVNLLAGSLLGAWLGATWATRMSSATLYRVLSVLLVFIAVVFAAERLGTIPTANQPLRAGADLPQVSSQTSASEWSPPCSVSPEASC